MKTTHILTGSATRKFYADCYLPKAETKGIVIFCHGFKGFKDWGTFPLTGEAFAEKKFAFITFNFSHNGTTLRNTTEFADLEAFGNNNFTRELFDLEVVIEFAEHHFNTFKNPLPIYLLGHSRGGGIAMLKTGEDSRIKKVAVWGSVNEYGKFWKNDQMEKLLSEGVIYVQNSRTNQQMPIYKQLYEDYERNKERLHIPSKIKQLQKPLLIVHGTHDETVPLKAAEALKEWKPDAEILIIENGNHSFGAKHPWDKNTLPEHTLQAVNATINFFNNAE